MHRPFAFAVLAASAVPALCGCHVTSQPVAPVIHPLTAEQRIVDHSARLSDGVARYREVKGAQMPDAIRDLTLTIAADGKPCFTEIIKDHWFHPYSYAPLDASRGTFVLQSAGANSQFGDADDLRIERGPGDPRVRTYGWTPHPED
jgi:hypothetical protein